MHHTVPDSIVLALHLITNYRVPVGVVSTKLHARSIIYILLLAFRTYKKSSNKSSQMSIEIYNAA